MDFYGKFVIFIREKLVINRLTKNIQKQVRKDEV